MVGTKLIQDTGLLLGKKAFKFSLEQSIDDISNIAKTIKQYREYAHQENLQEWTDYIHEIFHILGFKTTNIAPRLIGLQGLGADKAIKALVCVIQPNEHFDEIIPDLDWQSYLYYAAKHHQVDWAIMTNGLKFKVMNFSKDEDIQKYIQYEFDEIIKNDLEDSFFTIYKLFSLINYYEVKRNSTAKSGAKSKGKKGKRVLSDVHYVRKDFWTELLKRSNQQTDLFSRKTAGVENYLNIGGGKTGLYYNYIINYKHARIELYIDFKDYDENKKYFDNLLLEKRDIEKSIGESLVWDRLEKNRASIIRLIIDDDGLNDRERWTALQDKMIHAMIKFVDTFSPYINKS